tara:strand:- start:155 stop:397 length:243 start_codon:yes stop_codon:yes gene_type:complete
LKKIINDSIEEGWIHTRINAYNKREVLIYPTELRIKFWLLYSKRKLLAEIENKVDIARNKLIDYYNIEKNKEKFNTDLIK